MLLCRCFHLLPGDAVHCPFCRRSLNHRYCPSNHPNPLWNTRACLTCGQAPLTPRTYALPLGWAVSLLTLLLLLWGWHWVEHHPFYTARAIYRARLFLLSVLFEVPPRRVHSVLTGLLAWYVALYMLSYVLPGATGKTARQWLRSLPAHCWCGLRYLLQALRRLVFPPRPQQRKPVGGKLKGAGTNTDENGPL